MHPRPRIVSVIAAAITSAIYLAFCLYAVSSAWQRKEGDLPPISPWLQDASLFIVCFPFGFFPGFDSIVIAPIINAILWGTIVGAICFRFLRRKSPDPLR
jgi:hypothetical protein